MASALGYITMMDHHISCFLFDKVNNLWSNLLPVDYIYFFFSNISFIQFPKKSKCTLFCPDHLLLL